MEAEEKIAGAIQGEQVASLIEDKRLQGLSALELAKDRRRTRAATACGSTGSRISRMCVSEGTRAIPNRFRMFSSLRRSSNASKEGSFSANMPKADIRASGKEIGHFRPRWSGIFSNRSRNSAYKASAERCLRTRGTRCFGRRRQNHGDSFHPVRELPSWLANRHPTIITPHNRRLFNTLVYESPLPFTPCFTPISASSGIAGRSRVRAAPDTFTVAARVEPSLPLSTARTSRTRNPLTPWATWAGITTTAAPATA